MGKQFLKFFCSGRPAPKGSYVPANNRFGVRHSSKYLAEWEQAVIRQARLAGLTLPAISEPSEGGYRLKLDFYFIAGKTNKYSYPTIDLDKLVRSTVDALVKSTVIGDDKHVVEIVATKNFGLNQGAHVEISHA